MAQPSQEEFGGRVVSARVPTATFMSLQEELADRGLTRQSLIAGLVRTWLNAVTGRGHRCTCPDCPGNIATIRRRVDDRLFEEISA